MKLAKLTSALLAVIMTASIATTVGAIPVTVEANYGEKTYSGNANKTYTITADRDNYVAVVKYKPTSDGSATLNLTRSSGQKYDKGVSVSFTSVEEMSSTYSKSDTQSVTVFDDYVCTPSKSNHDIDKRAYTMKCKLYKNNYAYVTVNIPCKGDSIKVCLKTNRKMGTSPTSYKSNYVALSTKVGKNVTFVFPDAAGAVTYSSTNTAVATISNKGIITPKKAGITIIRVTSGSDVYNYCLTVKK